MPILPCRDYYRPILQSLHAHPDGRSGPQLTEDVARATGLTPDEREETVGDRAPTYVLRIRQARYRLKSRDFVVEHADDRWTITGAGQQALDGDIPLLASRRTPPTPTEALPLKESASQRYATLPIEVVAPAAVPLGEDDPVDAPLERVERALREIEEQLESDLLQRLYQVTPTSFERIVLKLLEAMGYGKPHHTGGPGDRGIDGILYADHLELEGVCVQAKLKQRGGTVTPREIRDFFGALSHKRASKGATKGVFITTGTFSKKAQARADDGPEKMALIDGRRLAALMREFGVGVSVARVRVIPELDRSFFDGGG